MAYLELKGISKKYHPQDELALYPINFSFETGKIYSFLGPSGCGKTTLLNIISGLVPPTQGEIFFDNVNMTSLSTQDRNLAQVFQFPVIYKTMTVFQNLAFPLKNRNYPRKKINFLVQEMAELLSLSPILNLKGDKLGPVEKQLVCLGRGLIRRDVRIILFDEPLTLLSSEEKSGLRRAIKKVHQRVDSIFIYVTHDQNEALSIAHETLVMRQGKVLQVGDSLSLYSRPQHPFVGHFIGSPGMNFFPVSRNENDLQVAGKRVSLDLFNLNKGQVLGDNLLLGFRPESLLVTKKKIPDSSEKFFTWENVVVLRVEDWGEERMVLCEKDQIKFKVKTKMTKKDLTASPLFFSASFQKMSLFPNSLDFSFVERL